MIHSSDFKPAWWLRNPHAQTLWAARARRRPQVQTYRERLELPDGDFLDLDFTPNKSGPLVLVLHGLQGSIESPYAAGILRILSDNNYRAVLMHFRSCSGELNRLSRLYHSGETEDPLYVIKLLRQRFPNTPIAAIGYSLGGNVLLKLLGEQANSILDAAVAISVPMLLNHCADRLNTGFSRLYQRHLLNSMLDITRRKRALLPELDFKTVDRCKSLWEFDNEVTAKLHGFQNVHDYYKRCSSRQFLSNIKVPTLIVHAKDDPFTTSEVIPNENQLSPAVRLELSSRGGHVGFVGGRWPWKAHYWLEQRIIHYLNNTLKD